MRVLLAVILPCLYSAGGIFFARREYRRAYAALKNSEVPAVYGRGWMTPEDKHSRALADACRMYAIWPCLMIVRLFVVLVTWSDLEPEKETTAEAIKRLHRELDMDPDYDPDPEQKPCPCGYVTECHIHCGDGSCHEVDTTVGDMTVTHQQESVAHTFSAPEDPWLWAKDNQETVLTVGPEGARMTSSPRCAACAGVDVFNDFLKDKKPVPTIVGDLAVQPCTCGQNKIRTLGAELY